MMLAFVGSFSSSTSFWKAWMFMHRIWIVFTVANCRTRPSCLEWYVAGFVERLDVHAREVIPQKVDLRRRAYGWRCWARRSRTW